MPEIFFTTNPAEWTALEGLYISERKSPGFIAGVSANVVGIAGKCVRGPTTPQEITSTARFVEVYGERDVNGDGTAALVGEVWRALLNKPFGKVIVQRAYAAAAVAASIGLETAAGGAGTIIGTLAASSPGTWGNSIKAKVETASDADATHWNLRVKWLGSTYLYENLNTSTGVDNTATVIGDDAGNLITFTKSNSGRPVNNAASTDGADTDGYITVGVTQSGFTVVAGTDGSIAASDYNTAIDALAAYSGVSVALVAEDGATAATYNGHLVTIAALAIDRLFLTWSGANGQAVATEASAKAAQITTESDRIVWCYNAAKILDPVTGLKIASPPHHWLASILSQNDVDVHPGADECKKQLAGALELYNQTLTRADLITLLDAGISALEKVDGGFAFHSAVCTDGSEITTRRSRDFLQLSAARRLRTYVKSKATRTRRLQMVGELKAFSQQLQDDERIIEAFEVRDDVTSTIQAGMGLRRVLWRVRFIGHMRFLVLETDMGTGVVIDQGFAA